MYGSGAQSHRALPRQGRGTRACPTGWPYRLSRRCTLACCTASLSRQGNLARIQGMTLLRASTMSPDHTPERPEVTHFIERFGVAAEAAGWTRIAGKMLAYLIICQP